MGQSNQPSDQHLSLDAVARSQVAWAAREKQVFFSTSIPFYVLGLVSLYFGEVVITATLFCIAVFCSIAFVECSIRLATAESELRLSERIERLEKAVSTIQG